MPIPWIPILGSIAGAAVDAYTSSSANQANARNVDKQIAFQREQNATAYQRAVADMKAAGLNPALAYQQGGANSGAGAAATAMPITQNSTSKFATAVDTYNALANGAAQRDLLRAQASATDVSAGKTSAELQLMQPDLITRTSGDYRNEYFKEAMARLKRQQFEHGMEPERFAAALANLRSGTAQAHAATAEARSRTTLNEQEFQTEYYRKHIAPLVNSTAHGMGAATGLLKDVVNLRRLPPAKRDINIYNNQPKK